MRRRVVRGPRPCHGVFTITSRHAPAPSTRPPESRHASTPSTRPPESRHASTPPTRQRRFASLMIRPPVDEFDDAYEPTWVARQSIKFAKPWTTGRQARLLEMLKNPQTPQRVQVCPKRSGAQGILISVDPFICRQLDPGRPLAPTVAPILSRPAGGFVTQETLAATLTS